MHDKRRFLRDYFLFSDEILSAAEAKQKRITRQVLLSFSFNKRPENILKLHAKCASKRTLAVTYSTLQKFTKTKPSVSSFVVAIKYAHIRDL